LKKERKRFELVIPVWLFDELKTAALHKGVSIAEYIKDLIKISVSGH
jgi:hypothetical protein